MGGIYAQRRLPPSWRENDDVAQIVIIVYPVTPVLALLPCIFFSYTAFLVGITPFIIQYARTRRMTNGLVQVS